ncbi:MAG: hypothetical protein FJ033_00740 [Chloroflexi bacterium]|nr:hypothetical protein [Chloroflexota bacterium]
MDLERVDVDFLLMADRAEAINGKLYMLGGAWDRIGVADFQKPILFSVAIGMLVPWNATNMSHTVLLTIRDADAHPVNFRIEASFVTGRPPQLNGETQRVLLAVPNATALLRGPGQYLLSAAINGRESKVVRFIAHPVAPDVPAPPSPG